MYICHLRKLVLMTMWLRYEHADQLCTKFIIYGQENIAIYDQVTSFWPTAFMSLTSRHFPSFRMYKLYTPTKSLVAIPGGKKNSASQLWTLVAAFAHCLLLSDGFLSLVLVVLWFWLKVLIARMFLARWVTLKKKMSGRNGNWLDRKFC